MIRYIQIIILIGFSFTLSAQSHLGVINDPDGYTNIREGRSIDAEIIGKMKEGEIFEFTESSNDWYKIKTNYGIEGFMHKSRIKEIKFDCGCNGYGSKNAEPIARYCYNQMCFSICGYFKSYKNGFIHGSELLIQDCLNEKRLNKPSINPQKIQFSKGKITLYELKNLPVNKIWKHELTPITKSTFFFVSDNFEKQINIGVYNYPKFSKAQSDLEYKKIIDNRKNIHLYEIINRLLVLSLNEHENSQELFLNLKDNSEYVLDGEYSEHYINALIIYEMNKE